MVLEKVGQPLVLKELPIPIPNNDEVLIKVSACGVCRTDLHIFEGDLTHPKLPLILGHQIVGTIEKTGERVGVPWLGETCQQCEFCLSGRENLCDKAIFTGYQRDGGFAEYCTAKKDYILPLPQGYDDLQVAPLLCAGLIGYRALRLSGKGKRIGFYGFGSSAHLLIQAAQSLEWEVFVFTKPHDQAKQQFALSLGATWAGGSDEMPPELLDAAILFAPVGQLYPQALKATKKGGRVISAGIHMSDIPSFPYSLLWEERTMSSVANLTRQDGKDYMKLAENIGIEAKVTVFPLEEANQALAAIKNGQVEGSIVLKII